MMTQTLHKLLSLRLVPSLQSLLFLSKKGKVTSSSSFAFHPRRAPQDSSVPIVFESDRSRSRYLWNSQRRHYFYTTSHLSTEYTPPPPTMTAATELLCVNTIRAVSADQPQAANSGHPGAPMGCAPMAYLLWAEVMNYSSKDSDWVNRDRFVLSNGHACALQYTMLHLTGYDLTTKDLSQFRQLHSKTPGHPECFETDGIEVCTGPLGQGISNAVGLAMAERHMAATFNVPNTKYDKVFDHFTYVICGDGCMQEGVASEACSLAGHLGLGRLIVMYDDNHITIDGETSLSFTEDVLKRFEAYGWHTQTVTDAESDLGKLRQAIETAKGVTDQPSIIKVKTKIGFGSPSKEGLEAAHGAPLGVEDLAGAKKFYGLPPDKSFYVPAEVQEVFTAAAERGDAKRKEWETMFADYTKEFPDQAAELSRRFAGKLPEGILDKLPTVKATEKALATRKHSQNCLAAIGPHMPELIGGSADLTPSNLTNYPGVVDFQKDPNTQGGRYLRFGVREHAMVAISNGIFAYGGLRPYCATFLVFTGYALGAMRVSALSKFGIIFIMTHDSIGLGEDGPTHQPIEHLEMLRAMPNIMVWRPADGNETSAAYKVALEHRSTPSVICCSRSGVPNLETSSIAAAAQGAYVVVEEANPDLVLIGTGTEVGPCVEAAKTLTSAGVKTRVVSMPCQEVFLHQSSAYQQVVLPGTVPTLSVEAAAPQGWHRFSHAQIAMESYGHSGNGNALFKYFGFTADSIVTKGKSLVDFYKKAGSVPDLNLRPTFEPVENGAGPH